MTTAPYPICDGSHVLAVTLQTGLTYYLYTFFLLLSAAHSKV